jgi:sulfatase modifying factor 1
MVQLPLGYCIDSTEVTRAQYKAWLDTTPPTTGQITECSWNTSFTPSSDWPPTDKLDHPVSYVDWCDAYAYCLAVGKRLCGKIGGGSNSYVDFNDPTKSQWFAACSAVGAHRSPYGDTYDGALCNTTEVQNRASVAVGFMTSCQTSTHIYDMSGNVAEWEDSCEGPAKEQYCHLRGGSYCQNSNWKCNACGYTKFGNNRNNSNARTDSAVAPRSRYSIGEGN